MITSVLSSSAGLSGDQVDAIRDAAYDFVFKGEPAPAELWGDGCDDINSFVYLPYRQKSALAELYGPGADVGALLQADWLVARELGAVRLFKGSLGTNVSFPIHVRRSGGEPITVSIKENWDEHCGNEKPWYLSYVPEIHLSDIQGYACGAKHEAAKPSGCCIGERIDLPVRERVEAIAPHDVQPRDELAQWARLNWDDVLPALAEMAIPEPWGFNGSRSYEILRNYLSYTFHRLRAEEKVAENKDAGLAAFDTGLLHRANFEPIYACFWIACDEEPRLFAGFCRVGVGSLGKKLASAFGVLPERATYFTCVDDLIYDARISPAIDYEHILLDNMSRLPLAFLENELGANLDAQAIILRMGFCGEDERKGLYDELSDLVESSPMLYRRLTCALESAISLALRKIERSYGLAMPFYYAAARKVSQLIPLDLTGDGVPDVALATQRTEAGTYLGRTILTLQMAYNGARLISGLEGSWLSAAVESEEREEVRETEACFEPISLSA